VVDVVLLNGGELAGSIGGELDALIDGRTVAYALEHHGAADDQLDRAIEIAGT
jgi:hypothetical protein